MAAKSKREQLAITIRGAEADDWEDVAEVLAGENVVLNTLQLPYQSRDKIRDRMENPRENNYLLVAEVDEVVVGMLGLHAGQGRRAHVGDIGMMVHPDYQGRGVGTALMQSAIDLADRWLNLVRLELEVFPDNAAGIALYRKMGFEIEGTLRYYAFRDGQYADSYLMARIRDEQHDDQN